ncbi:MAG: 30S ribosome-binding factor RbfA [Lachnospiraceae bacterium]|jgi:ribosome-binding factor A|nr:30S ribosome-binding factor RbfA [Lachnospiraceae bacterium]
MRKNSVKNRKVNDVVMRELAQILRDIKDPRVSPMTSVLSVEVAPDLKNCKVWISVLGSPEEGKRTMEGIRSANGFIRSELAHRVNLRNTPELHFILDDSIAYGVEMGHKIDEVTAADEEADRERREKGIDIDDLSGYDLGDDEDQNL